MRPEDNRFFTRSRRRARSLVRDPQALMRLIDDAQRKSRKLAGGPLDDLMTDLKALLRLIRAYATGEYRAVSRDALVVIVAAVLYVVSPVDLVPDFLPAGLLDDATVLAFALRKVKDEVDAFLAWERRPDGRNGAARRR